jgi:hypothetical protein
MIVCNSKKFKRKQAQENEVKNHGLLTRIVIGSFAYENSERRHASYLASHHFQIYSKVYLDTNGRRCVVPVTPYVLTVWRGSPFLKITYILK